MGYVSVEVDIDLDDIDDDDLFKEVGKRIKRTRNDSDKKELISLCEQHLSLNLSEGYGVEVKTLDDDMKMDLLMKAFKQYSLTELENRLTI